MVNRRHLVNGLKYGLGIVLLAYVVWRNWEPDPATGGQGLKTALERPIHFAPLVLACLLFLPGLLITFFRWSILVRAQGLPFTVSNAVRLGLIGFFLNSFLPGSIGGDIIKAAFIAREQSRRTVAVATVLIDRAVGLWGLVWLVFLSGGVFWALGNTVIVESKSLQWIVLLSAVICGSTFALWFVLGFLPDRRADIFAGRLRKLPRVGHMAAEFWKAVWMYRRRGRSIFQGLVLSVVGHLCFVLSFHFAAQTFQEAEQGPKVPSLQEDFLIVPIGFAIQSFIPTPGGVGGGEYGFGKLYRLVDSTEATGVLASLAYRVINWFWGLIGYSVYLRMRPALRRHELQQESAAAESQEEIPAQIR